jgi:uncharacterized FlaG/YvyC family protein
MSTDFSIRPVGVSAPSPAVQPASQAVSSAVATELPASQTVTAADNSAVVRNDIATSNEFVSREAFFDREASAMVYQVLDSKTDQVVEQYPDEAVLRRRAYFHALDMSKDALPRVPPTDRTA